MIKILFICLGNICRSPMAEFVFKDMARKNGVADMFCVASCATSDEETGNDIHYGTRKKLSEMNIPFSSRHARRLVKADYEEYDYLIAMEQRNVRDIMRIINSDPDNKVKLLLDFAKESRDIADPWYTGNFDAAYSDICEGCEALLKSLC